MPACPTRCGRCATARSAGRWRGKNSITVLTGAKGVRADMTASWLAQMGWEVYVREGGYDSPLEISPPLVLPRPDPAHRYRRPYEGTGVAERAMQAYLDWEYGLVEQLRRDATHGFYVI